MKIIAAVIVTAAVVVAGALLVSTTRQPVGEETSQQATATTPPVSSPPVNANAKATSQAPTPAPGLQPGGNDVDPPAIKDATFARIYGEFVEAARLTPDQDRQVRVILRDVQVNTTLLLDDVSEWQQDQGILHHMNRSRKNTPEAVAHAAETQRIYREARDASDDNRSRILAEAETRLREVLSEDQMRIFRALLTVGDVQLDSPFAI